MVCLDASYFLILNNNNREKMMNDGVLSHRLVCHLQDIIVWILLHNSIISTS